MQKKLLLALLIVIMLVCLFAITVSAENRTSIAYTDIDGVIHNVPVVKDENATAESVASVLGNTATTQSWFVDNGSYVILKATDNSLTAYPTWYIVEPSGTAPNYIAISEVEYGYVNKISGKTYERGAVRYIEFPNTLTAVRNNNVFGASNATTDPFYEVNVTDVYIPNSVTSIESRCFYSAPKLKNVYVEEGNGITAILGATFTDSSVEYVQFENLTELVSIDGFADTDLNCDIDLSNSNLKTIGSGAFKNCQGIGKITLPDTVESIGESAFEDIGNGYLASPYLPASLTSIGKRFFALNIICNSFKRSYG